MKYLCLIYVDDTLIANLPGPAFRRVIDECRCHEERLRENGQLLAAQALEPVESATTLRHVGAELAMTDGPFAETKELVAGYWIWQCTSLQEAIAWVKRCPNPMPGESEIEIRQIFDAEDFGEALTPELREQEEHLRERIANKT